MTSPPDSLRPIRQRAHGCTAISVERMGAVSGVRDLAESGSARIRLPTTRDGVPEAVLINTAGGIAAGDLFETMITAQEGASLVVTTAAAEKVYRSESETSEIRTRATLAPGSRLDWVPQETILFDRSRLRRRLDVELDPSATAFLYEATVFGRAAHDEIMAEGAYEDRWRVRRAGRLIYADTFRLAGAVAEQLARPAIANGARALATLLYVAPDAEARLDEARGLLEGAGSECGASTWSGLLAMRWLAPDIATLRRDASRFMTAFRGKALPRVWHL